ncbi:MAG: hypothetical protein PHX80_04720 [Candidatus Nanoarchaeia archaeon]|nr:hypothetical protein [Candidatus Nanoarchaeia archaeon]
MIKLRYNSRKMPLVISLDVATPKKTTIRLIAFDETKRNTKYMDRTHEFEGSQNFIIRLPQSPDKLTIEIISKSERLQLVKKEVLPLRTQMSTKDFEDKRIGRFVAFCQEFALRAGYLSIGKYEDDSGSYEIQYLDTIKNDQTGKEITTPARISVTRGTVQVSQKIFSTYTIPGRVAILLHEFCHVFKNNDAHSEIEADFHAAQIYCALGYPRVEILKVFAAVFYRADTNLNRLRLEKLIEFVNNFDTNIQSVKYGL